MNPTPPDGAPRELGVHELPPEARARVEALARGGAFTSSLSVAEFAAVQGVGLDPVGQVMGLSVYHLGYMPYDCGYNYYGSGYSTGAGYSGSGIGGGRMRGPGGQWMGGGIGGGRPGSRPMQTTWAGTPWTAPPPSVATTRPQTDCRTVPSFEAALRDSRDRAVGRLRQEAVELGADGVVGVHLEIKNYPDVPHTVVVSAVGTAVRFRAGEGRFAGEQPFLCDLTGQDVATLLRAGWVPSGLAYGIAVCVRHDDYATRSITMAMNWSNQEVPGYTDLVHTTRARARQSFAEQVRTFHGDGAVMRDMVMSTWETEPADGHRDHLAQVLVIGTAIARMKERPEREAGVVGLPIMRLNT